MERSKRAEAIADWADEVLGGLETGGDEYEFVTITAGGIKVSMSVRELISRFEREEK